MTSTVLQVRMLDKYTVTCGNTVIEDTSKRSGKVWLLLAYLVCNRKSAISADELVRKIWDDGLGTNPAGTLKTTMWRVRQLLEGLLPGVDIIKHTTGGYVFVPEIKIETDFEEFERLCLSAEKLTDDGAKCDEYRKALSLYKNDFLERYASEAWVSPLTAYYNSLYVKAALAQLSLLKEAGCAEEAEVLARQAIKAAPYNEEMYRYLMHSLMEQRKFDKADAAYEDLRARLFANLGVMPDKESKALHNEILRHLNHQFLSLDTLQDQLKEKEPEPGPLFCDFYVFKQFYQAEARSVSRRGDAIHVGVLTVAEVENNVMAQYIMEQTMVQLQQQIVLQLRQGDVVSRCSGSQFAIMLQANYENSNKVCDRIIKAFRKANPFSPSQISYSVLSLEPMQIQKSKSNKKHGWNK